MKTLQLPCETGKVSDGFHTFDELYEHRISLFLAIMKFAPFNSWISKFHDDGTMFEGWFVGGINLETGDITYHLPISVWHIACLTGARQLPHAPPFDGHTPADVVKRLQEWASK